MGLLPPLLGASCPGRYRACCGGCAEMGPLLPKQAGAATTAVLHCLSLRCAAAIPAPGDHSRRAQRFGPCPYLPLQSRGEQGDRMVSLTSRLPNGGLPPGGADSETGQAPLWCCRYAQLRLLRFAQGLASAAVGETPALTDQRCRGRSLRRTPLASRAQQRGAATKVDLPRQRLTLRAKLSKGARVLTGGVSRLSPYRCERSSTTLYYSLGSYTGRGSC